MLLNIALCRNINVLNFLRHVSKSDYLHVFITE